MRQPVLFVIAGGLQYLFDTLVYGLLLASGVPGTLANVLSRASAALLGFGFNRYVTFPLAGTFAQSGESWSRFAGSLFRFGMLWVFMTILSSLLLLAAHSWLGGGVAEKVVYKLVVEAVLAIVSFIVSKRWVFRH